MRWFWYGLVASATAMGIVTGVVLLQAQAALTPVLESPHTKGQSIPAARSLAELYQIRDRLMVEIQNHPPTLVASSHVVSVPTRAMQALQAVEVRIEVEETAQERWQEALKLADEAHQMGASIDPSVASEAELQPLYDRWKAAVDTLKTIPAESFLSNPATQKQSEFGQRFLAIAYYYDTARSGFLRAIAASTGMESQVHLTVCTLKRECRRLRGNEPPASPASLIKVPVAVALMEKLTQQNINPETKILVQRGNWTEDAGKIWVGSEYSLKKIMADMISFSGNIATNQLIDYVGRDYINQVMRDRGYSVTRVNTKLVGQSTYPANAGVGPNSITTDELTDMMVGIYNNEHPGDTLILDALVNQYDWELGYEAIKRPAVWIGEKTGQNSKVLGTTVGVNINGERYIITVAIDHTASEPAVKKAVKGVVDHLLQTGGF